MEFDTKIKILLSDDLEPWQELNVTAFLMSGIAGTQDIVGEPYRDKSGRAYLPMCRQPVMIHSAGREKLKDILNKVLAREDMVLSIFIEELFHTPNDDENRAKVAEYETKDLNLVGLGVRGKKTPLDKIFKGIELHK